VLKSDMPWKASVVGLTKNLFSLLKIALLMMIVMNFKLRLLLIRSHRKARMLNQCFQQLMKKQKCQQKTLVDVNWQDYLIDTVGQIRELIVVPAKEATVLALET